MLKDCTNHKIHSMNRLLLTITIITCSLNTFAQLSKDQYKADFDFFWNTIRTDYCYWDKKQTNWQQVKTYYSKSLDTISSKTSFVLLLEKVFHELYDHHASLNTNTMESYRLVPSGSDIWAEYIN